MKEYSVATLGEGKSDLIESVKLRISLAATLPSVVPSPLI